MIKIRCAHCGQKLGLPEEAAGRRARCTRCAAINDVPREAASDVIGRSETASARRVERSSRSGGSSRRSRSGALVGVGDRAAHRAPAPEPIEELDELEVLADDAAPLAEADAPLDLLVPSAEPVELVSLSPSDVRERVAGRTCPGCGSSVGAEAVLCVQCGRNLKDGSKASTRIERAPRAHRAAAAGTAAAGAAGNLVTALVTGGVAAVIGGGLWAGVVILTSYEIGRVAWGVGLIVGLGVASTHREPSLTSGMTAAGLAVVGLFIGKAMIFQWGVPAMAASELVNDPQYLAAAVFADMVEKGEITEVSESTARDLMSYGFGLSDQLPDLPPQVHERLNRMSLAEQHRLARDLVDKEMATWSTEERIQMMLSPYDLLWFGLALATAGRLGYAGRA